MPLKPGDSRGIASGNAHANGGGIAKADGGYLTEASPIEQAQEHQERSGLLHSAVAGRTDHLNVTAGAGAYVIPADVVSGIGEGNTLSGAKLLHEMFSGAPYGVQMGQTGAAHSTMPKVPKARAKGGRAGSGKPVPILAAGGEFMVSPKQLAAKFGSVEKGHKIMDAWVVHERKKITSTMSKLPGPAKD